MSQGEADQIIGQLTDATVHLFNRNLDLVQRLARSGPSADRPPESEGPAQEVWSAWTESAGDLVQISYLAAQLVDSLWGRGRTSPGDS